MKIILTSENSIRLIPDPGPMTIEAPTPEQQYSPFHMLGSSLAFCTFSVMYSWATHVKIPVDDLTLDVAWEFAEDPHRVGTIDLSFDWPSLPAKRLNAAKRAAELCTVHATLSHPPQVTITAAQETRAMSADEKPVTGNPRNNDLEAVLSDPDLAGTSGDQSHGDREVEVSRASDPTAPADLPPKPAQQGDGQESGTARTRKPSSEAR